jgi:hypothetical protein
VAGANADEKLQYKLPEAIADFETAYDCITVDTIKHGFSRALGAEFADVVVPPPSAPAAVIDAHLIGLRAMIARELAA